MTPFSSVTEVYDKIIQDLERAIGLLAAREFGFREASGFS